MANLQLDILVVPTYDVNTLGVADASVYPTNPPLVSVPSIEIDIPGFGIKILPFVPNQLNVFTSSNLGITVTPTSSATSMVFVPGNNTADLMIAQITGAATNSSSGLKVTV